MEHKANVAQIRRLLEQRKELGTAHDALVRFLVSKGVSRRIAQEIVQDYSVSGEELSSLRCALAQKIHVAQELQFEQPKKVALVGPTGVGKTTTLLKLAGLYQHLPMALVSLDHTKGGAFAQIQEYAEKMAIPFFDNLEKIDPSLALTLIDTSGCNYYQPHRIDELGETLSSCGECETLLTLSVTTKDVDLYGAIHQFSSLNPKGFVFTKLDETLAPGVLVNVCSKTDIPICYIAFGYPLPGDVQVADPQKITHKILTDLNEQEFQYLRQLSISEQ